MLENNLKYCRNELEMTQSELGYVFGVNKATVSNWENGYDIIPLNKLIKFCNLYNYSIDFVVGLTRKNKIYPKIEKLDKVCSDIQKGIVKKRGWNTFSNILGKTQNIWCGLCVNKCPMHNLELVNGKVKQNGNCTLCYRCVNICPKQSCTVYFTKKPKKQYKGI